MSTTSTRIPVTVKKDFIESLTTDSPTKALSELIWNGFDAGSDLVDVVVVINSLQGIDEIRVKDAGIGIDPAMRDIYFGNIGNSWKGTQQHFRNRALHGKNGKGRFKAFSLGSNVEWKTVFHGKKGFLGYTIYGQSSDIENFTATEPIEIRDGISGSEVIITGIHEKPGLGRLLQDNAFDEFARLFAAYLKQYPGVRIIYNGRDVDPISLQETTKDFILEDIDIGNKKVSVCVTIIEWKMPIKRVLHLCDANGISLYEAEAGVQIRAPGFHFTAYIKSDHFRDLDKDNLLILDELHPDVDRILRKAKLTIRNYFRGRLAEQQSTIVQKWKDEQIYPYSGDFVHPLEQVERQVFDILAVNLEAYLPAFEEADNKSRKFMFLLLAQALKQNPESVQKIITDVLSLKKEEQEDLAKLLQKTQLSSIISSAKTIANRLDFLIGLENLLFDKETKKKLLERDQLHKILESEAWIFREDFTLSASEQRLEEVLEKHVGMLDERADGKTIVDVGDGKTGRLDLMLSKSIQVKPGTYEYLIVELKRPTKKITDGVVEQIKRYAKAVANDERFHSIPADWTFIAVSNEITDTAKQEASQTDSPRGRIASYSLPGGCGTVTVWIYEWAELIERARARLQFLNERLNYEADRDSAKQYLQQTHAKFIPVVSLGDEEVAGIE